MKTLLTVLGLCAALTCFAGSEPVTDTDNIVPTPGSPANPGGGSLPVGSNAVIVSAVNTLVSQGTLTANQAKSLEGLSKPQALVALRKILSSPRKSQEG